MTIEKLNYFVNLCQTLNYSLTAKHFSTTQSNVSKQIIALEKDLDITLFQREHRTIILSDAGEAFLPYAKTLLADYQHMQEAMVSFRNTDNADLHIGTLPVMSHYQVPELLIQFHKANSLINLVIKEQESVNLLSALDEGIFEVICTRLFQMPNAKYERLIFNQDELAVILPANHPLAKNSCLSLSDLKQETFYQLDQNTNQFQLFYNACSEAGFEPNVAYSGTRIDNILSFISSGMGISLLMQHSVASLNYPGITIIPLEHPIKSKLAFLRVKNRKHSNACILFWDFLKNNVSKLKTTP